MSRISVTVPQVAVVSIVAGASLLMTLIVLALCANRGLDLTDESYYIAWTNRPADYAFSIHPFGLFFHGFFELFDRSIIALRLWGVLLLTVTGSLLGLQLARYYRAILPENPCSHTVLMLAGALFSLDYYMLWIMTPSYNMLANASAALIAAGCLGWFTHSSLRADRFASALVGLGACWAFFGKPTFGLLAAFAVIGLLILQLRRDGWPRVLERVVIVAVTCVAPLLLHILSVMSVGSFIESLREGMQVLNFGNSLTSLPAKTLLELNKSPPILVATGTAFVFILAGLPGSHTRGREFRPSRLLAWPLLIANLLFLWWRVSVMFRDHHAAWQELGVAIESTALACICLAITGARADAVRPAVLAPVIGLMVLPWMLAFGTANDIVMQIGAALFAALLAALLAAQLWCSGWVATVTQAAYCVVACALILYSATVPWQLPTPMTGQTEPVQVGFTSDTLLVDPVTKQFIEGLRKVATDEKLMPHTPVFDLSGQGPATALLLGGWAPGYPWLPPHYANSTTLINSTWGAMSNAAQQQAWIVGPIDARFAATDAVAIVTARADQYECVGSFMMMTGDTRRTVDLWKPVSADGRGTPAKRELCPAVALVSPDNSALP